jgi:hypothetical protein
MCRGTSVGRSLLCVARPSPVRWTHLTDDLVGDPCRLHLPGRAGLPLPHRRCRCGSCHGRAPAGYLPTTAAVADEAAAAVASGPVLDGWNKAPTRTRTSAGTARAARTNGWAR